jgi:hypothetical protein
VRLPPIPIAFLGLDGLGGDDVGARIKSGQGVLTVASLLARPDPAWQKPMNRTAVGLARPSTTRGTILPGSVDARLKSLSSGRAKGADPWAGQDDYAEIESSECI